MEDVIDRISENMISGGDGGKSSWKDLLGGTSLGYAVLEVTPSMAVEMLENPVRSARSDAKSQTRYAEAMRSGGWIYNAMPIIFSRDGILLDGYQRLNACLQANSSFRTLVAFNVNEDTLHSMDQQRSRTFANVLEARGFNQGTTISTVLSKLIRIENGTLKLVGSPIGWLRLEAVFEGNPEIVDALELSNAFDGVKFSLVARTVFCFMALKAGHGERLRAFLTDMTDMNQTSHNPARMVDNVIDTIKKNTRQRDVDMEIALLILAFNDYLRDFRPTEAYSWTPDFGKGVKLRRNGRPVSMAQANKKAPPNCGLPEMLGFTGTENAKILNVEENDWGYFHGRTANMLKSAAGIRGGEGVYHFELDPETAREWMAKFNKVNRNIQKNHVARMVSDIRKGLWMVNAQPICFHGNPFDPDAAEETRMINGQHRLQACIEADIPIEIVVATGVPDEAFATYDVHARRSKIVTSGDPRVLESAAVFQWRKELGKEPWADDRPTNMEISQIIDRYPEMSEYYRLTRIKDKHSSTSLVQLSTAGVMTFFMLHIHQDEPELATQFIEELRSGLHISPDNPVSKARNKLVSTNRVGERMSRKESLRFLMELWNSYKKWSHRQRQLDLKVEKD